MDPLSEIRKSIKGMASGKGGAGLFTAKVLSTDGETCCVEIDGLVASDVRLRAVVNGEESGVLITPKTGSYVTVADLSGDLTQLMVVGFSEVEKIDINTDAKIVFLCCEKTKGVKRETPSTIPRTINCHFSIFFLLSLFGIEIFVFLQRLEPRKRLLPSSTLPIGGVVLFYGNI